MGTDTGKGAKKIGFLRRLLHNYDVVMLQEIHGTKEMWERFSNDWRRSHLTFFSLSESQALGGIAIIVKVDLTGKATSSPRLEVLESGRAGILHIEFEDGQLFLENVHHHDLLDQRGTIRRFAEVIGHARASTTGTSLALLGGDFSYILDGEKTSAYWL